MEKIFSGLPLSICIIYLDDILVSGRTLDNHIKNLKGVFHRLREAKLKLSPKNVLFSSAK